MVLVALSLGGKIALFSFTLGVAANAAVLFDNGGYSGDQIGRFNGPSHTIYDNFTITAESVVNGISWSQHDESGTYTGTILEIFIGSVSAGNLIYSDTQVAARTPNATGTLFGDYAGFDYSIGGLNIALSPGTYFLGLHTVSDFAATWDQTTGNSSTIAGRYQSDSVLPVEFYSDEDSVFQLNTDQSAVPEPGTLSLLALGAAGLVARRTIKRA
jgi:hypothetical protein